MYLIYIVLSDHSALKNVSNKDKNDTKNLSFANRILEKSLLAISNLFGESTFPRIKYK